jgi:hypothetical protein
MIIDLYPELLDFQELSSEYDNLEKKINSFIQFVEANWKT